MSSCSTPDRKSKLAMHAICSPIPLLSVQHLRVRYSSRGDAFNAVDDVSFTVEEGETVGIVGESGCGKSSLGKAILRLVPDVSGSIVLDQTDITHLGGRALRLV